MGMESELQSKILTMNVPFEIKQMDDSQDDYWTIAGYGSTFGNVDRVDDIVVRGAFVDSISDRMPKMFWQHDYMTPIGAWTDAKEDDTGLYLVGRLPKNDTFVSGRVYPQLKIGSITEMSIGYSVIEADYTEEGFRLLRKVDLWEVSLVSTPANPLATIESVKNDNGPQDFTSLGLSLDILKIQLKSLQHTFKKRS